MAWASLSPGPIFKETGFIPIYPPIHRSTTPAQRNTDQSSRESSNKDQEYPDSPVSKVYDVSNTSSNLIILNNRMKTKSGSHLRGHSAISRCSSPDPQRHRTEHTVHKNTTRHTKCLDSSTPREHHKSALMWHNQSERPARKAHGDSYVDSYRHVSCRVSSDPATLGLEKCKLARLRNPAHTHASRGSSGQSGGSHLHPNQFYIWSLANIYITQVKPQKQHRIDLVLRQQNKGQRKQQGNMVNRQNSTAGGGKTKRNSDKRQKKKNTGDRKEDHSEERDKDDLNESADSSNKSEIQTSKTMTEKPVKHERHSQSTQSDTSDDEDTTDSEISRSRTGKICTNDEERQRSENPGRRENKEGKRGSSNEARKKTAADNSKKRQSKSSRKAMNRKSKSKRSHDTNAGRNHNDNDLNSNKIESQTSVNKQKESRDEEDNDKENVKHNTELNHVKETSTDSGPTKPSSHDNDTDRNSVESNHERKSVDSYHDTQENANVSLPSTDDEFGKETYSDNEEDDGLSSDSSSFSDKLVHHREGRLRPKSRLGYRPRKSKSVIAQTEHTQGRGSEKETQIKSDEKGDIKDNPQLGETTNTSTSKEGHTNQNSETQRTNISKSNEPQSSHNEQADNPNKDNLVSDLYHLSDEDDENISERTWGRMMQQEWRNG